MDPLTDIVRAMDAAQQRTPGQWRTTRTAGDTLTLVSPSGETLTLEIAAVYQGRVRLTAALGEWRVKLG